MDVSHLNIHGVLFFSFEEYFFHGLLFKGLHHNKWVAATASSLLFAVYHIAIFATWFTLPMMTLALLGLFLGGMIFCFAVQKTQGLMSSYIIHMSADIGVVIVGVFLMKVFE